MTKRRPPDFMGRHMSGTRPFRIGIYIISAMLMVRIMLVL